MNENIPILKADELNDFHYRNIEWQPTISETKHQKYHLNRLENFVGFLKFPLPPHRKTVHDFSAVHKKKCE